LSYLSFNNHKGNLMVTMAGIFLMATLPLASADFQYREALPGYHYQFPRDHFEHEDFRTEWWYYTGNVQDQQGKRFGFELVFFRQGAKPGTGNPSTWAVENLYLAHAAVTDPSGKKFLFDERLNRKGPGIAGASAADSRVWNGNWQVKWTGEKQVLDALGSGYSFHFDLTPLKPLVIHGEDGISRKAEGKGRASHYVSFPRLAASGTIQIGRETHTVSGTAWMDHEWFSQSLSADQAGWDWFSIQLENKTELMLFRLRRKDGTIDPNASGTFIDAAGKPRHLSRADFTLEPGAKWGKYPIEWRVKVPTLGIDITAKAVLPNQAIAAKNAGPKYWEGAVDYSGSHAGVGYLEMTGYEGAVSLK
jgi:predicted secreted hydrolase